MWLVVMIDQLFPTFYLACFLTYTLISDVYASIWHTFFHFFDIMFAFSQSTQSLIGSGLTCFRSLRAAGKTNNTKSWHEWLFCIRRRAPCSNNNKRCFKINNHGNMVLQEILDSASALEIEWQNELCKFGSWQVNQSMSWCNENSSSQETTCCFILEISPAACSIFSSCKTRR